MRKPSLDRKRRIHKGKKKKLVQEKNKTKTVICYKKEFLRISSPVFIKLTFLKDGDTLEHKAVYDSNLIKSFRYVAMAKVFMGKDLYYDEICNPEDIVHKEGYGFFTRISTLSDDSYDVKETPGEIIKKIEDARNLLF